MSQKQDTVEVRRLIVFGVLFATAIYIVIRFFTAIAGIVLLFSVVALFTLILSPVISWLERHKIPRYGGTILLVLTVMGLLSLAGWHIYPVLRDQSAALFDSLPRYVENVQKWLADHLGFLGFAHKSSENGSQAIGALGEHASASLARIGSYTITAIDVIASLGIMFISTIYTLANPRPIVEHFLQLLGPGRAEKAADILQRLAVQLRRWGYSVLAGMLAVGILTWVALGLILHLPFALPFAVLAALLEIVPIIGPVLSGIPPAIVALGIHPGLFLWVVIAFIIIQHFENHVIVPLIIGHGVNLHPVSVIFSVTVLGALFGIIGIFISVPTAITVKILIDELYIKPRENHVVDVQRRMGPIIGEQNTPEEDN